ncbi:MAG: stage III sporulation protein AE [Peptococcaceae bacterium]|nr:stage III sporulation protein AE [Peptococcaceae bacterium]
MKKSAALIKGIITAIFFLCLCSLLPPAAAAASPDEKEGGQSVWQQAAGSGAAEPAEAPAGEPAEDEMTEEEIREHFQVDTGQLEEALAEIDRTLSQQGLRPFLRNWFGQLKAGERSLNFTEIKELLGDIFFYTLKEQRFLLGQLLVLAALSVLLQQLAQATSGQGPAKAGQLIILLLMMTIIISTVKLALQSAQTALTAMGSFMEVLVPLMMTVMYLLGQSGTVMLMKPMALGAMAFFTAQIRHIIFPLILIYLALVLADALAEGFSVNRLAKFIKQVIQWGVGLTMTLFSAVLTISGCFSAASDGITLRTAKFLFGNLIPVAGKVFADVLDTAAGSAVLLKNTMGAAGMVGVLALTGLPLLRIFIQAFLLKLVGALVEPLGDQRTGPLLEELGNVLMLIFTVLGAMAIMTVLTLSAIMVAGNTAVMLR